MMGRAGRPQYDQHGKAVILVHEPKKSFYKKVSLSYHFIYLYPMTLRSDSLGSYNYFQFLYEPFPVESSLKEQLHDHINAEIVSGTICHKEDAVHYLSWTYLFRRLVNFLATMVHFLEQCMLVFGFWMRCELKCLPGKWIDLVVVRNIGSFRQCLLGLFKITASLWL